MSYPLALIVAIGATVVAVTLIGEWVVETLEVVSHAIGAA